MIKLWDTLVFGCRNLGVNPDRGFRERKISCPRLRKFRESSADSLSAPIKPRGQNRHVVTFSFSCLLRRKLYSSRLESTRDEAGKIKMSCITASSSSASSSGGALESWRLLAWDRQRKAVWNFTLLVRMNSSQHLPVVTQKLNTIGYSRWAHHDWVWTMPI